LGSLNVAPSSLTSPPLLTRGRLAALRDYLALGKPRLNALVLATTLVGYLMARPADLSGYHLAATLAGTLLAAFGANALNAYIEADRDARMRRTRERPLPGRRIPPRPALWVALLTSLCGVLLLAGGVNLLAAFLAAAAVLIYVLGYTPLKTRTPLCTLVGAVAGAIPPIIGWAAAAGRIELGAGVLAGILFLWQVPHALALAWLHRDDYERAGFRLLPSTDSSGRLTCHAITIYALTLLPLGLTMALIGSAGPIYAVGSLLLGLGLIGAVLGLQRARNGPQARRVFLATVTYLPLLLGLMLLDRTPPARQTDERVAGFRSGPPEWPLAGVGPDVRTEVWTP
jgi:protoheme IX farnesyltransferase